MNILMIGDIIGDAGTLFTQKALEDIKNEYNIDFCIANGENASDKHGITRKNFEILTNSGIDVITMGNHTWQKKDILTLFQYNDTILRPLNYPKGTPGSGYVIKDVNGIRVLVINIMGRIFLDPIDCPFTAITELLEEVSGKADITVVDFHAEATSEKVAMGWYLDGKVSAVIGTHTHVQTGDEKILTDGTGYITDVGMTGPYYSVLGMDRKSAINRFLTRMPSGNAFADGTMQFNGVVLEVDNNLYKTTKIERVNRVI